MSLRFPYLLPNPQSVTGATVSNSASGTAIPRPLVPVAIIGQVTRRRFPRALLDSGSEDTIFPAPIATMIGTQLYRRGSQKSIVRWRGTTYPLRFGNIHLELTDGTSIWKWPAEVGFSDAPLPYVILGNNGCLEFFDATFFGESREVELKINSAYAGTGSSNIPLNSGS